MYEGKDKLQGDTFDMKEKDVVALARRGLIEIVKEKGKAAAEDKKS